MESFQCAAAIGAHAVRKREAFAHLAALLAAPFKLGGGAANVGLAPFDGLMAFRAEGRGVRVEFRHGLAKLEGVGGGTGYGPGGLSALQPSRDRLGGAAAGAHGENDGRAARDDIAAGKNAGQVGCQRLVVRDDVAPAVQRKVRRRLADDRIGLGAERVDHGVAVQLDELVEGAQAGGARARRARPAPFSAP